MLRVPEQLSMAVGGVWGTDAPQEPRMLPAMLIFAGQDGAGAMVSITVIVCDAAALLPAESVAVQVRRMTRGLAGEPAPPLVDSATRTAGVPQLSDTVASAGSAAGTSPAH